jgi:hypothetical protein
LPVNHPEALEPFVSPEVAAEFLSVTPRFLLEEARAGRLPAHPLGAGTRKQWRFLLRELSAAISARQAK